MRIQQYLINFTKTFLNYSILLLVFAGIGLNYGIYMQRQMTQTAQQFVNLTMLRLLTEWDDQEFLTHATPELQKSTTTEQLQDLRVTFTNLGRLSNYDGAAGGLFRTGQWWWTVMARYQVQAHFQRGKFTAEVVLVEQQGDWVIGGFKYEYEYVPVTRQSGSLKSI